MLLPYLIIFLNISAWAQTTPAVKVVDEPDSLEEFEHPNKGCPENSECDQVMGLQFQKWKELVSKLRDESMNDLKRSQFLEIFRAKYGLPTEFYTTPKSQQGFKPLFFASACKEHNPKDASQKILKGMAFVKSLSPEKAVVWRDQTQIEVPKDLVLAQPVTVYWDKNPTQFALPLGDQPLFIKNRELYVVKDEEGLFFVIKMSQKGDWKVEHIDMSQLSTWEEKRQDVKCPETKTGPVGPFNISFCKSVWDEDLKKTVVVKLHLGCML